MAFDVAGEAYDLFMGRYSIPLAQLLIAEVGIAPGDRVLDVGCGPGSMTSLLVEILGAERVAAVDPSPPFVEAVRRRLPGVATHLAGAELMPFPDTGFDAAIANLVVPFMADPDAGLREMRRVVRDGGVVAATAWDHMGAGAPLAPFWSAVIAVEPDALDESTQAGAGEGDLETVLSTAGLREVRGLSFTVRVTHPTFEDWWEPYTLGVGPAGDYLRQTAPELRARIEESARELLGGGPFDVTGRAWCAIGAR
ncbi:class I SAM-dependent methyltransferase [Protaetiibacter mangrovi]|uniref:Class I SAM-dependent methyltransferase n=1 Tax=Protaetiibacter mangrovi TaxID=2970926 RepID=A0ABT1ZBZ7_9MICO|nr:class I SAM-dependent methyltransferase [Protaetiibacter mangrovi]MCS0498225.1 class I SAM-dependent methyltransferase [Protaetiibacter mangrovi]TPX04194.1 class I SAM-dependent methyltransferase [Schumannella luteola]